jgi:uncharacterized protein (TIGR02466 family)
MERELIPLFSKPLYTGYVDIGNIDLNNVNWIQNNFNWTSEDMNVLDKEEFKALREKIMFYVFDFFYGFMRVDLQTKIDITESWLNKTEKGQMHHRHWHPNSILSGVVFLATEGDTGKLRLVNSQYNTFEFDTVEPSLYNATTWAVKPEVGKIALFPSGLEHMVDTYEGDTPRISLAFNTFIKGTVNTKPLTKLEI